jgi:hypothetical protein
MARYNQQAGRTPQNWQRRYANRLTRMEAVAAKLGGTLEASAIGGPGVPGRAVNHFVVVLPSGERLERREACRRAGFPPREPAARLRTNKRA